MNNEKETVTVRRTIPAWAIVLFVLGFPLWFSLIVAAAAVVFALYVTLWALIIALWGVWLAFVACVLCAFLFAPFLWLRGEWINGTLVFGTAIYSSGIAILMFSGCVAASRGAGKLTVTSERFLRNKLSRKENA